MRSAEQLRRGRADSLSRTRAARRSAGRAAVLLRARRVAGPRRRATTRRGARAAHRAAILGMHYADGFAVRATNVPERWSSAQGRARSSLFYVILGSWHQRGARRFAFFSFLPRVFLRACFTQSVMMFPARHARARLQVVALLNHARSEPLHHQKRESVRIQNGPKKAACPMPR